MPLAAAKANAAAEPGSQQKAEGDSQAQELIAAWVRADGVDPGDAARRLESRPVRHRSGGHLHDSRILPAGTRRSRLRERVSLRLREVSGNDAEMVAGAVRDFWRRRLYPASTLLVRHAFESGFLPRELAEWTSRRWARVGTEGGMAPTGGSAPKFGGASRCRSRSRSARRRGRGYSRRHGPDGSGTGRRSGPTSSMESG